MGEFMTIKKAIVLLYPPYNDTLSDLTESVVSCCTNHNFTVDEIIIAESEHDIEALRQLVQAVTRQDQPVTLIMNSSIYTSQNYILVWSVIGTLSLAGLIDEIRIYRKNTHVVTSHKTEII